jgi:hypothetical protein
MKILIGIMYSIENELGECITAINRQTYRNFSLFLVKRLPNKQAHDRLYGTFTEQNAHYDLFLKIDADMVLTRTTFLAEVVAYFRQHSDVDNLQVAVFDCICDRLIYGLHVYNRRFRWSATDEPLFVDRRSASPPSNEYQTTKNWRPPLTTAQIRTVSSHITTDCIKRSKYCSTATLS